MNGVARSTPFFTTRNCPPCSATSHRSGDAAVGACTSAVAVVRPVAQAVLRVNPLGCERLPLNCTVALAQAETLPAASRARARTTCWPEA